MSHFKKLGLMLVVGFIAGCGPKQVTVRPGAANAFDSATFDVLVTVQAALETASKEITAFPNLKPELNHAIDLYNAAQISYKAYHEAAAAGKPADQAALDTLIKNLSAAVSAVIAKLHPPAPVPSTAMLLPEWSLA